VDVRLAGRDVSFVFVPDPGRDAGPPAEEDQSARITLRLPESLKARAEAVAAGEGASLNSWLVKAVARALDQRPSGHRLRGFARS
jgi:hypothetical protein